MCEGTHGACGIVMHVLGLVDVGSRVLRESTTRRRVWTRDVRQHGILGHDASEHRADESRAARVDPLAPRGASIDGCAYSPRSAEACRGLARQRTAFRASRPPDARRTARRARAPASCCCVSLDAHVLVQGLCGLRYAMHKSGVAQSSGASVLAMLWTRASWPLCVSCHSSADSSPTTLAPTSGPLSLATARRSFAPLARQAAGIVWSTRGCVPAAGDLRVKRLGAIAAPAPPLHVRALRRAPATAAAISYGRPQRDGLRSAATARGRLLRRAATTAQAEPIGGRWRLRRARAQRRETTADAVLGLVGAAADAAHRIVDGSAAMGRGAPSVCCDGAHAFRPAPTLTRATLRERRHRRAGRHLAPRRRVAPIAICSRLAERPILLAHPRQPHRPSRRR